MDLLGLRAHILRKSNIRNFSICSNHLPAIPFDVIQIQVILWDAHYCLELIQRVEQMM